MTTYNTGNPIGSTAVKDLYDNAQNFDTLANTTTLETVPDRLGVPRMSLHGFEQEAKRRFEAIKFQPPIPYAPGIEVTTSSLTVDYLGVLYYALPSALPFTTGAWNPAQWSPLQNTNPGNELLVFDDYAAASAAAATLPDGQEVECPDGNGVLSRFKVEESALLFQRLAGNAKSTSFIQNGPGAIGRTVEDKLRELPSIEDYVSFVDYINASVSSNWYAEYGGKIRRFTDRVFMGDAAKNNGRNEAVQADWLTTLQQSTGRPFGFFQTAQGGILQGAASIAQNAFVVGSQTATLQDNFNAVGLVGVGVSNKTTGTGYGYGAYLEAYRMPGTTGGAYAIEIDPVNFAALTGIDPYFQDPGQTIGIQIASGAELPSAGQFDTTAAINIQNNGSKFFRGIVFGQDSLTGSDGVTGLAEAITLAKGHTIQWWGAQGVQTSSIYCEGTTTAGGLGMRFSENQLQLRAGGSGKLVYQIFAPTGSVNYVSNRASTAGSAVQVMAQGDDANIDLQLLPKGLGLISMGTWASNADAPVNGYITIRDAGGTVRKLATIA